MNAEPIRLGVVGVGGRGRDLAQTAQSLPGLASRDALLAERWAADPTESGKGLGRAVCTAAGYRRVYLLTDDYRTAALAVYLKLGFVPFAETDDAVDRWRVVFARLSWPGSVEIASPR